MPQPTSLPPPATAAAEQSRRLEDVLRARVEANNNWLDFADFMQAALYEPGLGYYSSGTQKFGPAGDFITAPELTPLFAECLAAAIAPALSQLPEATFTEFGAGSGALTAALLPALDRLQALPAAYQIVEVSADLRARQRAALALLPADLRARVVWLDGWPAGSQRGVVFANEVMDALPVSRFELVAGEPQALGVAASSAGFGWALGDRLQPEAVAHLPVAGLPDGYRSELCPRLPAWLNTLADGLEQGLMILADYGMSAAEYFHPQRTNGTLTCHYRHHRHDDPFLWPGLQDVSAWVNFSAAARALVDGPFKLAGYTTQAHFLLANGLEQFFSAGSSAGEMVAAETQARRAAALRQLLLPGEMGEHIKFLVAARDMGELVPPLGRDFLNRL